MTMRPNLNPLLLSLILPGLIISAFAQEKDNLADDCDDYGRVYYESPADSSISNIIVTDLAPTDEELKNIANLPLHRSPHGTRWVVIQSPDFLREDPWMTNVYIFGNRANPLRRKISFRDHGNGGVHAQWINEKLISLRVWWGRIVSTDMIFDVENANFIYMEDANYGNLIMSCEEKLRNQR